MESRRLLAVSAGWDGAGLGSAELTYTIANSPASLSQAETTAAIETALAVWSEVVDITFTETDQTGLRDSLDFSFTSIDGTGGTLAQAYFPDDINPARIAGDVQFDLAEAWEVGNSLGSQAFDLVYVAVHEIGHALGLDHSDIGDSVLAPYVSANQSFEGLDDVDITAIQSLYAPAVADSTADDDLGSEPVDETFNDTEQTIDDGGVTDDGDEQTVITAARQQRFDTWDDDENGLLTEDEVRDRVWRRLAEADADGDGGVSFEEFETFLDSRETSSFGGCFLRHPHGHRAFDQLFTAFGRRR